MPYACDVTRERIVEAEARCARAGLDTTDFTARWTRRILAWIAQEMLHWSGLMVDDTTALACDPSKGNDDIRVVRTRVGAAGVCAPSRGDDDRARRAGARHGLQQSHRAVPTRHPAEAGEGLGLDADSVGQETHPRGLDMITSVSTTHRSHRCRAGGPRPNRPGSSVFDVLRRRRPSICAEGPQIALRIPHGTHVRLSTRPEPRFVWRFEDLATSVNHPPMHRVHVLAHHIERGSCPAVGHRGAGCQLHRDRRAVRQNVEVLHRTIAGSASTSICARACSSLISSTMPNRP